MTTPTTPFVGQRFERDNDDRWRDAQGVRHAHLFTETIEVTEVDGIGFKYVVVGVVDHADPPPAAIRRNYERGSMLIEAIDYRVGRGEMREVTP